MNKHEQTKMQKRIEGLNLLVNLIWSFIFLFPLVAFCYTKMPRNWLVISLLISLLAVFVPASFFSAYQVSKSRLFYKKIGIEFFNRFTQNGTLLNRLVKNNFPEYKRFQTKEEAFKKLFNQTFMFEKFHLIVCIFFIETTVFAFINSYYYWVAFFIAGNVIYNVYPMLLQQYIRLRLTAFKRQ